LLRPRVEAEETDSDPRPRREGPAPPGPLDDAEVRVRLNEGGDAVAVRNDLAARDPRRVRNHRVEVLVADPLRDEGLGLVGLLGGLEETERGEGAVVCLDQVEAAETGELAELRDERPVDLADALVHAGRVDTFVTTNGGMHVMLLLWVLQGRALEWAHCGGQARGHSRRGSARASTASTTRANALVTP